MSNISSQKPLDGLLLDISGRWAHFKKPETNNNPLTHDFITKTALLGLMGAVLGVERKQMRALFPQWSDDLLYGVQINGVVKKESWSFTLRSVSKPNEKAPKPFEFLKEPHFTIALALRDERSRDAFDSFLQSIHEERACYTPVLGLHNCPAEIEWIGKQKFTEQNGAYVTKGFAPRSNKLDKTHFNFTQFRLGLEHIPTHQNSDFWNEPNRYVDVVYPSNDQTIAMEGEHFALENGEAWNLL